MYALERSLQTKGPMSQKFSGGTYPVECPSDLPLRAYTPSSGRFVLLFVPTNRYLTVSNVDLSKSNKPPLDTKLTFGCLHSNAAMIDRPSSPGLAKRGIDAAKNSGKKRQGRCNGRLHPGEEFIASRAIAKRRTSRHD